MIEVISVEINRDASVIASAEAYVDAPSSLVWAVKTNLLTWPEWNADVTSIHFSGTLAPGERFRWKAGGVPIASTLQAVDSGRMIGWTGRAPLGIRAVHTWVFEAEGEGTRVRTEESFDGRLVLVFAGPMQRMLTASLQRSVTALKIEAERRAREGAK
ncbi:SRPBCC family protein [Halomonas salipaludis]|uniref:Polyketide cyclase n=1 Tax=Halomonas salipaludis TaxID=2032625 RepID=A0A2A2EPG5_9GAMM|nr:polyketide cyclase [Halomonas salipaludis]